jgi:hypothetical protein
MILKFTLLPLIAATVFSFSQKEPGLLLQSTKSVQVVKKVPGTPTITNIMAGQNIVAGTITVVEDWDLLTCTVTYQLYTGWSFKEVQLYVGTCEGIPVNRAGEPRIGLFPYKKTNFAAGVQTWLVTVPLSGLPTDEVFIAAHCSIISSITGQTETGWGQGSQINDGGSWAMKFSHVYSSHLTN